jgi:hypothetical protein
MDNGIFDCGKAAASDDDDDDDDVNKAIADDLNVD